jgi:predicted ribosome-associated RNA-binding protein Tma20
MTDLKNIQKDFIEKIYDSSIDDELIDIYRNNIFHNLTSSLQNIYKTTEKIVGEKYFKHLALEYIKQHPSESGNLEDYGEYFPTHLKEIDIIKKQLPYLPDIAKIDWLYHFSYQQKDTKPLAAEQLTSLKEEDYFKLKFKLHPAIFFYKSAYPIWQIWQLNNCTDNSLRVNFNDGSENIIIMRQGIKTLIEPIDQAEYVFLQEIQNGKTLYAIFRLLDKENLNSNIGDMLKKFSQQLI